MDSARLLEELKSETYVMIRPSPIAGIGVFALRDIPKGCRKMFSTTKENPEEWIPVDRKEIGKLPEHSKALVETYCLYDDTHYYVPEGGFKKMDLVNFLNHSEEPNVVSINEGEFFEALRDINQDEELLIDYGKLVTE
ncbi:MAG: SET domain-containing protein [Bacteroidota bacterium]